MKLRSACMLGAVAAAALALSAPASFEPDPSPHPSDERQRILGALGDYRELGVRLSGSVSPWRSHDPGDSTEVVALVAEIEARRGTSSDEDALTALGLTRLAIGRFDEAIRSFEQIVREHPRSEVARSDLAAALLARGRERQRPEDVVRALDLIGPAPAAATLRFNRALALEELLLRRLAAAEWEDYLRHDPDSPWAAIARERRDALPSLGDVSTAPAAKPTGDVSAAFPTDDAGPEELHRWVDEVGLPAWTRAVFAGDDQAVGNAVEELSKVAARLVGLNGDRLAADDVAVLAEATGARRRALAEGIELYEEARGALEHYEFERARALFEQAAPLLRDGRSPRALWADAGIAQCGYQLGLRAEALPLAERTLKTARQLGYVTIQIRAEWILVQLALARVDLERALSHATELERTSREAEIRTSVATGRLLLARIYDELGAPQLAWSRRMAGLRDLLELGDEERLALTIGNASFALGRQGLHRAAADFASEMLAFDRTQGTALGLAESLWIRAGHREKAGDLRGALQDVREAESYLPRVVSPENRTRLLAELRAVEGAALREDHPQLAVERLTEALSFLRTRGYEYGRPELLLERARALRRLGRPQEAAADLDRAARAVEAQRDRIDQPLLQVSFYDLQAELADERVAASVELDDATRAFWAADQSKGLLFRAALGRSGSERRAETEPRVTAGRSQMDAGDAVLSYWSLPDELLIWVLRPDRAPELVRRPFPRTELATQIDELARVIEAGGSPGDWQARAAWLYDRLIGPIEDRLEGVEHLVIVPDRVTRRVPWPALNSAADGSLLVARFVLRISPAASTLFDARTAAAPEPLSANSLLLALGDPTIRGLSARLPRLPSAREEVQEISRLFVRPQVLLSAEATRERFLAGLEEAAIAHVATHFVAGVDLWSTTVVLADDGETGTPHVQAREIAELPLSRLRLAVLSGCETQWEGKPSLEGTFSVAGAFLAAGTHEVVATLWPVDDRASASLMEELYRGLLEGQTTDEALRAAQLTLAAAGGGDGSPAGWAGFQLLSLRLPEGVVQP